MLVARQHSSKQSMFAFFASVSRPLAQAGLTRQRPVGSPLRSQIEPQDVPGLIVQHYFGSQNATNRVCIAKSLERSKPPVTAQRTTPHSVRRSNHTGAKQPSQRQPPTRRQNRKCRGPRAGPRRRRSRAVSSRRRPAATTRSATPGARAIPRAG